MGLVPALVVLVADTEIDGELVGSFPVVLEEAGGAPLTAAGEAAAGESDGFLLDEIEEEVRAGVSGGSAVAGKGAGVVGLAEGSLSGGEGVVLLVADGLGAEAEEMLALLDGEVIAVVEVIVAQDLRSAGRATSLKLSFWRCWLEKPT